LAKGGVKRKYHLVKWSKATSPKQKGGLGIKDLRRTNLSLLRKWWWKQEYEEGLWQDIVKKKYKIDKGIAQLRQNPKNSSVWNDLLKVKQLYLKGRIVIVGNGSNTDFWEYPWCGMVPFKDKFKEFFDVCTEQKRSVAEMTERGWRMNFRRRLDERAQFQLRQLRDMLSTCALSNGKDIVKWTREKSGKFSVQSMYKHLFSWEINKPNKNCGKPKSP
jgi:hypothetical protein